MDFRQSLHGVFQPGAESLIRVEQTSAAVQRYGPYSSFMVLWPGPVWGMHSFSYLFDQPVQFQQAPELFCLDLFKEFGIGELEALASPAGVRNSALVSSPAH